jgi:hypothetical protein
MNSMTNKKKKSMKTVFQLDTELTRYCYIIANINLYS